jgi:hypothetical protein
MQFYNDVRSKLVHRTDGFDFIFRYLKTVENPLIVETGCARQLDNYEGDGQSSLLFDKYIKEYGGEFHTVDISEESTRYCESRMTSSNSVVYTDDSITRLKKLNQKFQAENKKIDFLYLDSFDAPRDDPEVCSRSALHHLFELLTIIPSLKTGALIGVDDNWIESKDNNNFLCGKGFIIYEYMNKIDNPLSHNGYQLFWKLP